MSVLDHNTVVTFLGACDCPCHAGQPADCWCHTVRQSPHRISHNDAVRHMPGGCRAHSRDVEPDCRCATDPQWRRAFERKQQRDRDRRVGRGQITNSADVRRAIQLGVMPNRQR